MSLSMTKKAAKKKASKKVLPKKLDSKQQTMESLVELIRITSTVVPDDVFKAITTAAKPMHQQHPAPGILLLRQIQLEQQGTPIWGPDQKALSPIGRPAGNHQGVPQGLQIPTDPGPALSAAKYKISH